VARHRGDANPYGVRDDEPGAGKKRTTRKGEIQGTEKSRLPSRSEFDGLVEAHRVPVEADNWRCTHRTRADYQNEWAFDYGRGGLVKSKIMVTPSRTAKQGPSSTMSYPSGRSPPRQAGAGAELEARKSRYEVGRAMAPRRWRQERRWQSRLVGRALLTTRVPHRGVAQIFREGMAAIRDSFLRLRTCMATTGHNCAGNTRPMVEYVGTARISLWDRRDDLQLVVQQANPGRALWSAETACSSHARARFRARLRVGQDMDCRDLRRAERGGPDRSQLTKSEWMRTLGIMSYRSTGAR